MKVRISIIVFVLSAHVLCAQSSFIPQSLGPNINSEYDEIDPVISADGKTLYFTRVNHPDNKYGSLDSQDIWYSELKSDGTWTLAQPLSELNIGRYNAVLSSSQEGKTLLINGVYNHGGTFWKNRGISVSDKYSDFWGTPERLKIKHVKKMNRGVKSSASASLDEQFMVFSFSTVYNGGQNDLFVSRKKDNGKWTKPKALRDLNTHRSEITPFLAADNKTIYFSHNRDGGGNFLVYKAIRSGDNWKRWSNPVAISDTINAAPWQAYYKTTAKGSWAYFSSTKASGNADIFKVKVFEENPFVVVSGKIIHAQTKRPLIGKDFSVVVNGQVIDSIKVNKDSATYKMKLPLRSLYTLSADGENFRRVPTKLDVSGVREFFRTELNLPANPVPYTMVKGKLLIKNTNQAIPAIANPVILVNGVPFDSATIDAVNGTYSLTIPYGDVYTIQVNARRYNSSPAKLDLTKIDEYREVVMDLQVDEEKMAVVSGRIIDKKRNRPLLSTVPVRIKVEGVSSVTAKVDSLAATYEVRLPLGNIYTISASAPNYFPLYENIDVSLERNSVRITRDLAIVPIEIGQSVKLNNIFFESGKAVLKKESFSELNRVAEFLINNQEIKIEIGGHTDNVGKVAVNQKLSQARANAVATYIASKGVDRDRITSKGYGPSKPVASNATKAGKAQNRRVEFKILDL